MRGINAAAIVTAMPNNLISRESSPVNDAEDKPVGTILPPKHPHLSGMLRR
jgi:hypothetical protein